MISRKRADDRMVFRALIDRSVLAAVGEGVTSLAALLRYLPSVYPVELLASLDRLGDCGAVNSAIVDKVCGQARTRPIDPRRDAHCSRSRILLTSNGASHPARREIY